MKLDKIRLGEKEVMPFTIPSGIITTESSSIERIAREIPEIGILTTKSISLNPRAGNREPILARYAAGSFINAVGLTNPGAEEFSKKLSGITIPLDKFLLISAAGSTAEEFGEIIRILEPYADGFELNLSCPHAHGYGMQLGQDPKIVSEITKRAVSQTSKPVFAKLSPNTQDISSIAFSAMSAGAYGITAINTVGPVDYLFDSRYVLTNKKGGVSGSVMLEKGIQCVSEISKVLGHIPIIACGGISDASDVLAYRKAGASAFGIGSALAMMQESGLRQYFSALINDLENSTNNAADLTKSVDMEYRKFRVADRQDLAEDLHILSVDGSLEAKAGQFVFAWLPEKGEKPFSIFEAESLKIAFSERGCFTKELARLKPNDVLYFRGPYGVSPEIPAGARVALVGGGCGIAGISMFAGHPEIEQVFIGAKDSDHLIIPQINGSAKMAIATEDGSAGYKGLVTELLARQAKYQDADFFINCGPEAMVRAAIKIESELVSSERIYSSIDYMTHCGVGICGSCADKQGLRTCVEGPFMRDK